MKKIISSIVLLCFVCLMMSGCASKTVLVNYKEKDSERVSIIKELKITEVRKASTSFLFPIFKAAARYEDSRREDGKAEALIYYFGLGIFAIDIVMAVLIFPFELAFGKGEVSHYENELHISGRLVGFHTTPFRISSNFGHWIYTIPLKDGYFEAKEKERTERTTEIPKVEVIFHKNSKADDSENFRKGKKITASSPLSVTYTLEDGEIKQTEYFYEVKANGFAGEYNVKFDDLLSSSREVKPSNTIATEQKTFVSERNKKAPIEVAKAKKEAEKERERLSHYHSANDAYYALFQRLLVGDFIVDTYATIIQITDDGFLATFYNKSDLVFYVVSKGVKGNDALTDGMLVLIDAQITGKYRYTTIRGNTKSVPKVKASKIVRYL